MSNPRQYVTASTPGRERLHKTTDIIVALARYGVAIDTISHALVTPEQTVTSVCERAVTNGVLQRMPPQTPEDRQGAHLSEIVHLRQELADAKALVREIQRIDTDLQFDLCARIGLTEMEARLIETLVSHGEASRDRLYHAMYAERLDVDQPEPNIIDVHISNARRKLKAFGVNITTVWGMGYGISATDAALLRSLAKPVIAPPLAPTLEEVGA